MDKKYKLFNTFILTFILAFFMWGYVWNTVFISIDWVEEATIWDKFREYYIRTFAFNIIPAMILATLATVIGGFISKKRGN